MVALHVCQVSWTLAYKPLRSTRHIIVFFRNLAWHGWIAWDMFYFYSLDDSTTTRKRRYVARPTWHVRGQWPQPVARRSNWLRRASIRLAWYRHMQASSCRLFHASISNHKKFRSHENDSLQITRWSLTAVFISLRPIIRISVFFGGFSADENSAAN